MSDFPKPPSRTIERMAIGWHWIVRVYNDNGGSSAISSPAITRRGAERASSKLYVEALEDWVAIVTDSPTAPPPFPIHAKRQV